MVDSTACVCMTGGNESLNDERMVKQVDRRSYPANQQQLTLQTGSVAAADLPAGLHQLLGIFTHMFVNRPHHHAVLFCSLAVLDPRVGHTIDVLSPFISVFCHSD